MGVPSTAPLTILVRPKFEEGATNIRVVDLFCGCGGLTLGMAQALNQRGLGLEIPMAVDCDYDAIAVYRSNFPGANTVQATIDALFGDSTRARLSVRERRLAADTGPVDILVGGPPCQGHSDLNNHTRRNDPKNLLYGHMVRAAQVLTPTLLLIENVPAVQHTRYAGRNVVSDARSDLERLGYRVAAAVISLAGLGVAQTRKRHVLLAALTELQHPERVLESLRVRNDLRDLRWAIGDLVGAAPVGLDKPPRSSAENLRRMAYLEEHGLIDLPNAQRPMCHQNDTHSYRSMYGRLSWDLPAQTITSGFTSIGQGRYMHPSELRALTAHEAARIQGFPDYFDFSEVQKRASLATMIGNAVPPALSREIVGAYLSEVVGISREADRLSRVAV
ncbi:DNA cytosine methyltransferase [Mycobacteroides chelonae]|uniref:DNA cytosine methyltransferase n=1 Tax=Mycobacteroides chelonae TaxID=1774 RepID=UPI0008A9C29E|nr:DNA cytosine methyltransferase [Mycobacteroides chelonae]OHU61842.1 hypothetical protein BKG85_23100 [Mycobacteroides chelonae]